jgi:hypothetical protein
MIRRLRGVVSSLLMASLPWRNLLAVFLFGAFLVFILVQNCKGDASFQANVVDADRIAPGFTLLAPYHVSNNYPGGGEVLLIDETGRTVHRWKTAHPVLRAVLKDDGTLMVAMTPPLNIFDYPGAGTTGLVQELGWEGNVLWVYRDPQMTTDFNVLPDGSVVYARWDQAPASFAASVRGGGTHASSSVWTNEVVVVNKEKEITWRWNPSEHLNPAAYVVSAFVDPVDWSHFNSVEYVPSNPITHTGAFLVSMRSISTVFLIEEATGRVLWESPPNMLHMQHDPSMLSSGHILVFDNGLFTPDLPALFSRVVEIDPLTNRVVWSFPKQGAIGESITLASSVMGGAQRLANGNTLITVSTQGRLMEVTPEGDVVWEYLNTFRGEDGAPRLIFKARKYDPAGTEWGKLLSRQWPLALSCR